MRRSEKTKRLKEWARDSLAESDSFLRLCDKAYQLIDPLLVETALPEPCERKRNLIAPSIAILILNRYMQHVFSKSPGQVADLDAKADKFWNAAIRLDESLYSCGLVGLDYFKTVYDSSSKCECGRTPDWDTLTVGLYQLQMVAKAQLEKAKKAKPEADLKAKEAKAEADLRTQKPKAQRSFTESTIAGPIAKLYEDTFTNQKATVSRDPKTNSPTGPFVRFALFLERETNPFEEPDASPETIASALRRGKKARS